MSVSSCAASRLVMTAALVGFLVASFSHNATAGWIAAGVVGLALLVWSKASARRSPDGCGVDCRTR